VAKTILLVDVLGEKGSLAAFNGREERWVHEGEQYTPPITCDTCLERMERWRVSDE